MNYKLTDEVQLISNEQNEVYTPNALQKFKIHREIHFCGCVHLTGTGGLSMLSRKLRSIVALFRSPKKSRNKNYPPFQSA